MRPEIEDYLTQHGQEYNPDALRRGLLDAGYDEAEVDEALRGRYQASGQDVQTADERTFSRWTLWLHIAALVGMFVLVIIANGTQAFGLAVFGGLVLLLVLLLSWTLTSWIGRALLPRTSLGVALILPAASALILGGTCTALLGGVPGPGQ